MDLGQGLVVPVDDDFLGLGLVSLFHHHLDKFRLIQIRQHLNGLSLLDVHAGADDQLGILSQNSFLHVASLLYCDKLTLS